MAKRGGPYLNSPAPRARPTIIIIIPACNASLLNGTFKSKFTQKKKQCTVSDN